jgi:hypothetical protein
LIESLKRTYDCRPIYASQIEERELIGIFVKNINFPADFELGQNPLTARGQFMMNDLETRMEHCLTASTARLDIRNGRASRDAWCACLLKAGEEPT